jgi:hypothetical protein
MSNLTHHQSLEHAAKIVQAAAQAGSLKLNGAPAGDVNAAKQNAEVDGAYVAALMRAIATGIKTDA